MIVKINGQPLPPPPAPPTTPNDYPWWDVKDQIITGVHDAIHQTFTALGHAIFEGLAVLLPTIAALGILLWMCPFLPWSDKGPKITGGSLIIFMFYVLIRGAY